MQRRTFVKNSAAIGAYIGLGSLASSIMSCNTLGNNHSFKTKDFGIQLYSIKEDMLKSPFEVLVKLAEYGYKTLESFESDLGIYWGMSNMEFKREVENVGMKLIASHVEINVNFEAKVDEAAKAGVQHLICPSIDGGNTLDYYRAFADKFNECGDICQKAGIRFGYHNHGYSFKPIDGIYPQDILMENTDAKLVDFEIDLYWVLTAGEDPIRWLQKYPNRFTHCHLKDRENLPLTQEDASIDLGKGILNIPEVLKVAENNGLKHIIIEQERYPIAEPLEATKANANYLRGILD
jgi:sugar phosphate isomerase/epimerase